MRLSVSMFAAMTLGSALPLAAQQAARDSAFRDSTGRRAFALPPIVVTATVAPVRQDRIGFASSILVDSGLAREPVPVAASLLSRLPDVFVDQSAGPGGPTILHIRGGEEPYTKVLADGVPLNVSGGFMDIQGLTLSNVERVEVARGPHSALYGSSAMSGVVQYITRRGTVGGPTFDVLSEAGSATRYGENGRGEIAVRGGTPHLTYSAGGAVAYDRGIYSIAHNAWTSEGSLRLDATPTSKLTITGTGRYADIKTNLPVRDPGATRVPLDPNQRDGTHRLTSSITATYQPSTAWTHRLSVGFLNNLFYYGDMTDGVVQPAQFFVSDFTLTDHTTTRRATADYIITNHLAGPNGGAAISYGASVERETTRDILTGDFGNTDLDFRRTSEAGIAEIQAPLGERVSLLAGTRVEKYVSLPVQFTPRASLVVSAVPDEVAFRVAAGRSFKVPNVQQQFLDNPFTMANPNLAPETAVSWEGGVTLTPRETGLQFSLTYFHEDYRNLIRTVASNDPPRGINQNLGKSAAQGLEFELAYQASSHVTLGGNATWLKTTIIDNSGLAPDQYPVGKGLPFRPDAFGTAYADITGGRWTVSGRTTFVGKQIVLTERFSGQRAPVDAYAVAGLLVSWAASHDLSFYVRGDNLLDAKYQTAYDKPGLPFRFSVGMRMTS